MAKIAEMTTSELFVEMSDVQKDEIFRMVWASHVEEDVKSAMKDYHGHLPEDENDKQSIVEDVVNAYVYNGKYDCNLSYWENINNLIDRFC